MSEPDPATLATVLVTDARNRRKELRQLRRLQLEHGTVLGTELYEKGHRYCQPSCFNHDDLHEDD